MNTEHKITELLVPMDCNGCVQKIKRALHNIDGIYEVYIDVANQKLTVVGRAEPDKIVKAIKKTRKIAAICAAVEASNTESVNQKLESDPHQPKDAPPTENPTSDAKPPPDTDQAAPSNPKDVEEIYMTHHYRYNDGYMGKLNFYARAHEIRHETGQQYAIHSYNNYRPSPSISEDMNSRAAPQRSEFYGEGNYHNQQSGDGSQITSMFSEENPNACTIV